MHAAARAPGVHEDDEGRQRGVAGAARRLRERVSPSASTTPRNGRACRRPVNRSIAAAKHSAAAAAAVVERARAAPRRAASSALLPGCGGDSGASLSVLVRYTVTSWSPSPGAQAYVRRMPATGEDGSSAAGAPSCFAVGAGAAAASDGASVPGAHATGAGAQHAVGSRCSLYRTGAGGTACERHAMTRRGAAGGSGRT